MIPTLNDDPAETQKLAEWVLQHLGPDVPLHFTAFHRISSCETSGDAAGTLDRAREIALKAGLHFVYEEISTVMRRTLLSRVREGFSQEIVARCKGQPLKNGSCSKCGLAIPGVWDRIPGSSSL